MTTGSSTARVRPISAPDISARKRALRDGDGAPLVMVTAYDAPSARRRRGRRRHDPRRRLAGDGRARLRRHAAGDDRRHGAPHRRGRADRVRGAHRRRPAVAELPRLPRGDRAQRRRARARGRRRGEARGRAQAPRRGRRDPRRRDPGDGSPRPHPAVDPRARRVPGAGQAARLGPGDRRRRRARWPRPAASRSCSSACPTASRGWSPTPSTSPRSASARAGTATGRCSCTTTCSGSRTGTCRSSCAATPTCGAATAVEQFVDDVRSGTFPSSDETYHMTDQMGEAFDLYSDAATVAVPYHSPGSVPRLGGSVPKRLLDPSARLEVHEAPGVRVLHHPAPGVRSRAIRGARSSGCGPKEVPAHAGRTRSWSSSTRTWKRRRSGPQSTAPSSSSSRRAPSTARSTSGASDGSPTR